MFTIAGLGHQNTHSAEGVLFSAGPLVLLSERNAVLHNLNFHHISVGEEHTSIQNSDLINTYCRYSPLNSGSQIALEQKSYNAILPDQRPLCPCLCLAGQV